MIDCGVGLNPSAVTELANGADNPLGNAVREDCCSDSWRTYRKDIPSRFRKRMTNLQVGIGPARELN